MAILAKISAAPPKKKRIRVPRERGDLNDLNLCGPMLGAKFHF